MQFYNQTLFKTGHCSEIKEHRKYYLRGTVVSSYRDQSIDLQLDSLACVRDKSVGTPRWPFKGWRLYLAKSAIRFAEQLSAVERYVAH